MATVREVNPRRIYQARLAAGMSQGDLAHAVRGMTGRKTTERTIRNWERGAGTGGNSPHADAIPALAAATGVEISYLYGSDEEEEDSRAVQLSRLRDELLLAGRDDLAADLLAIAGLGGPLE